MPENISYKADRPMSPDLIQVDTFVFVPFWHEGEVAEWREGYVVERRDYAETQWIVRFPGGEERLYFAYSIMCGICLGRDDVTCCVCASTL